MEISSSQFHIDDFPKGEITRFWLHIINNGLGEPVRVPIMVARGENEGPVIGINAALHGNELNGIRVIQKLFENLNPRKINGTLIGVLVANVPGVLLGQRRFNDDFDLNRQAPGSDNGTPSSVYIHRLIDRVFKNCQYLMDLHTTGEGKENCYHVRADMNDLETAQLAILQNPEVIVNGDADNQSLRGYCSSIGIKSITLELKDPLQFQMDVVSDAVTGIKNVMIETRMMEGEIRRKKGDIILCEKSTWMRSSEGGLLGVLPNILDRVEKDSKVAIVRDIFGDVRKEFFASRSGVVIAKTVNPVSQTGTGIINIGYQIKEIKNSSS